MADRKLVVIPAYNESDSVVAVIESVRAEMPESWDIVVIDDGSDDATGAKAALSRDPLTWRYPAIEPFATGRLKVSGPHELYFEQSGNPAGKPVIFVHGGPGGGTDAVARAIAAHLEASFGVPVAERTAAQSMAKSSPFSPASAGVA